RLWTPEAYRVTWSNTLRTLASQVGTLASQMKDGVEQLLRRGYQALTGVYNAQGQTVTMTPTVAMIPAQATTSSPAPTSGWSSSYRVSLSGPAQLIRGILGHMEASSNDQKQFLQQLQRATDAGQVSPATLQQARQTLDHFFSEA
ncbi:MAG: hypothetical protein HQL58_12025, partial [Magnetococcales bacterium]|nr:hypothetical protein [Magnetococcales bacterium]